MLFKHKQTGMVYRLMHNDVLGREIQDDTWIPGVVYCSDDSGRIYWTGQLRWHEYFEPLPDAPAS